MKEDFDKIKKAKKTIKLFDPPVAQKRDLRDVLNEESKSEMVKSQLLLTQRGQILS
jgi:hypothetical protein